MDNFPNLLSFELSVKPRKNSNFLALFSSGVDEIFLTINFGEETLNEVTFLNGKVSFSLRGGKLQLKLTNGAIPLKKIRLNSEFKLSFDREIQTEKGNENEGSLTLSKLPSIVTKNKKSLKISEKIKDNFNFIRIGGTAQNRTWIFKTPNSQFILEGLLQEKLIAELDILHKPVSIEAIFEVEDDDIELTAGKLLFTRNIADNKRAWIEREIFLSYIKPQLQPYLSRVELSYE